MICEHLHSGRCEIATSMAGKPASVSDRACAVCLSLSDQKTINSVTTSLAVAAVRDDSKNVKELLAKYRHLIPSAEPDTAGLIQEIESGAGVGSQLWKLLSGLGVRHSATCTCLALARQMNDLGPTGCQANRASLAEQMRINAASYGWDVAIRAAVKAIISGLALRINPLDKYGSLLDEAIRLAEKAGQQPPFDILLPIGPGSKFNDLELRIALRSIERHAVGLRRIVLIGSVPTWLRETDCLQIIRRKEFTANKASRISLKVKWAFERLDLTPTIAFWNDDYVMLRDQDIRVIPAIYRGELWRRPTNGWKSLLQHTAETLQAAGLSQRHYDIHVPILYSRDKFLGLADWWERSQQDPLGFVAKSVYGNNCCEADSIAGKDCKLQSTWRQRVIGERVTRRWILSYGDAALNAGLGDWLLSRFPDPVTAETAAVRTLPRSVRRRRDRRRRRCCR